MDFRFESIREKYDLNKTQVAKMIDMGIRNYNYVKEEKSNIKLRKLNDYCNVFNVSMDYVCKLTKENPIGSIKKIKKLNKKVIAIRLEIIENELHIGNKEISNLLGIAPSTYSDYKSIKKNNLIQTLFLKKICSELGYSMDWVVGKSSNKKL